MQESKIKIAREKASISRKELSDILKIPYRTLQNWELLNREPPKWVKYLILETIENLAQNREKTEALIADLRTVYFLKDTITPVENNTDFNIFTDARIKARLTQQRVQDLFGIPIRTYQNWEAGINEPSDYIKILVINKLKEYEIKNKD